MAKNDNDPHRYVVEFDSDGKPVFSDENSSPQAFPEPLQFAAFCTVENRQIGPYTPFREDAERSAEYHARTYGHRTVVRSG